MKLLPSAAWRSLVVAQPLEKRAGTLEQRDENTMTETLTITANFTDTVHITEKIYSTIFTTVTAPPVTIHHTGTTTMTLEPQATLTPSLARVAPILNPLNASSQSVATLSITDAATLPTPTPINAAPVSPVVAEASKEHRLSGTVILAIVLGVLAFLGLVLAGAIFTRRMYRKYRQQRVLRKQIQTEGNAMPDGITGGNSGWNERSPAPQMTGGFQRPQISAPYQQQRPTGAVHEFLTGNYQQSQTTGRQVTGGHQQQNATGVKAAEAARDAEDCDSPPQYTINIH